MGNVLMMRSFSFASCLTPKTDQHISIMTFYNKICHANFIGVLKSTASFAWESKSDKVRHAQNW